jgi:hypothetical protein
VSRFVDETQAIVSWPPVPGALRYHVYRAVIQPIGFFLKQSQDLSITVPGMDQPITLNAIQSGQFDAMCTGAITSSVCETVGMVKDAAVDGFSSFPMPFAEVAVTANTMYTEPALSSRGALYYIRSEDASGNLSTQSNFVLAPSKALPGAPPTIAAEISPAPNALGWNNAPVTVTWHVTSADGVISPLCPPVTVAKDTAGTLLTCRAASGSGAPAAKVVRIKLDTVPPQLIGTRTPANTNGWNNTAVTVQFSCTDDRSGVVDCGQATQIVSAEGAGQSRTAVGADAAGNTATATVGGINIDLTPPLLTFVLSPPPNASGWNNSRVTISFAAADTLAGVATLSPPVLLAQEGANQMVAGTAVDKAGNVASTTAGAHIDMTPPEAIVRFDPDSLRAILLGSDRLSGVRGGAIAPSAIDARRRTETFVIRDLADNTLQLVRGTQQDRGPGDDGRQGSVSHVGILSLQYNNDAVLPAVQNAARFEWSLSSDGRIKTLQQEIEIGGRPGQKIGARFDARDNTTIVASHGGGPDPGGKAGEAGLSLLQLVTSNGQMAILSN